MARRQRQEHAEPLERHRAVPPGAPIYEVRAGGHTIEWTDNVAVAVAAFMSTRRPDREVWRLVNGVKSRIVLSNAAPQPQ